MFKVMTGMLAVCVGVTLIAFFYNDRYSDFYINVSVCYIPALFGFVWFWIYARELNKAISETTKHVEHLEQEARYSQNAVSDLKDQLYRTREYNKGQREDFHDYLKIMSRELDQLQIDLKTLSGSQTLYPSTIEQVSSIRTCTMGLKNSVEDKISFIRD